MLLRKEKNLSLLYMSTEAEYDSRRGGSKKSFSRPPKILKSKKKFSRSRSRSISPPTKKILSKSRSRSNSRSRSKSRSKSKSRSRQNSMKVSRTRSRSKSREIRNEDVEDMDEEIRLKRMDEWNPITFKKYSDNYYKIYEKVKELPAGQDKVKQDIFNLLNDTNILLITGDTGSGKTTQVPKIVWEYMNYNDTIICTQPRTVTASSVAKRVAEEMDLELGRHVGFRFKGSEKELGGGISGRNILVYMTEDTFLHNTLKDLSSLSDYGAIIIDEAHDRTIATDVLMYYIRETLMRPGVHTKFIIMSATLDKEVFLDYFKDQFILEYHITGRSKPVKSVSLVKSIYENVTKDNELYMAIERMTKLIIDDILTKRDNPIKNTDITKDNIYNDILVFLPSKRQIYALKESLNNYLGKNYKNFVIMDLSSDVPIGPERDIRLNPKPGYTKIILSTNIAETGVTVNGIGYVIDTGLAFNVDFDMETREQVMDQGFISQAEAKQREGRVGRNQPGICYRLYTNDEYDTFITHKKPAIYREKFDDMLLEFLFIYRVEENGYKFMVEYVLDRMISPLTKKGLEMTMKYFRSMNLVQGTGEDTRKTFGTRISKMGECFRGMEISFDNIYLLYTALAYDIEPEIIADIVAMLEIKTDLGGWIGDIRKIGDIPEKYKEQYKNEYGDIIGLYHIYLDYKDEKLPKEFVEQYMNVNNFNMIQERSERIQQGLSKHKLCGNDMVEPKYKVRSDMYLNIVSAVKQVYENKREIMTKELNKDRMKNNFLEMENLERVIYLSDIVKKIFGKNPKHLYDNFIAI